MTYVRDIRHHFGNMLCIAQSLHPKLCRLHAITSRLTRLISLAMGVQLEADHLFLTRIVSLGCALLPHNHKLYQDKLQWQGIDEACGVREQNTPQALSPCQEKGAQPPANFS